MYSLITMEQVLGPNPYLNVKAPSLIMPVPKKCTHHCVRKEFHKATKEERIKFLWAMRKLMENNGNDYSPWEQLAREHFYYASLNHNSKSFFPWHRLFTARLEFTLQQIDPSVCLLYWDWSYESQNWKSSQLFASDMLGMGGIGTTQCINGPFADVKLKTATHPTGCISRGFGTSVFYANAFLVQAENQYNTYKDWAEYWEVNPHAVIHRYIGGDMSTQYSPNDPIFYMHHGTVDLYYWKFQGKLAKNGQPQYDGMTNGQPVSLEDVLVPYPHKVKDVMSIADFCYSYDVFEKEPEKNITQPDIPTDFLKANGFNDNQIQNLATNNMMHSQVINRVNGNSNSQSRTSNADCLGNGLLIYATFLVLYFLR
eukprot:NODE_107_length_18988_cov_0.534491.p1 type:complete len:369 gc:universal NODE_107_length_18988_cov_0.534491:8228-9334(+)